ncbi:MAG TPA: MraY family glycosyltransferase [Solirubrobacteraceae bacterium]|nr:MraY family glycosyltransferase [Solirubrobacteraceae bacterium]
MTWRDALEAGAVAAAVSLVLTPASAIFARRVGAVDRPRERGLAIRETPRLGGLAMLAAVLLSAGFFVVHTPSMLGILGGAVVVTVVGALDDRFDLPAAEKLAGQAVAAAIPVAAGVRVEHFTFPVLGPTDLGAASGPLTVIGLVALINVVNLSDGVDGLAAGVSAIAGIAFCAIAFDLGRGNAAVLAAITAGAAIGFLRHNFPPASVFMGDAGSNLLGFLLGCVAVLGTVKKGALIALFLPLVILAVPLLDTGFVIAKRMKYRRPIHRADSWHFHHRLANVGFSPRRTLLYLYVWTLVLVGLALALHFAPYSDRHGHYDIAWTAALATIGLVAIATSVFLIYRLEILKLRRVSARRLRALDPETSEHEIDAAVEGALAGEALPAAPAGGPEAPPPPQSVPGRS